MDDLISREKAIEALKRAEALTRAFGYHNVIETIRELPSADAVPVIRCKDCKYASMTYDGECKYCDIWFPDEAIYIDGDHFCSAAEMKEE